MPRGLKLKKYWLHIILSFEQNEKSLKANRNGISASFWNLNKNQKLFKHKKNYTPKPGDIIFFKNAGASHTGIVIGCANGFVYTIEGNTNNTVAKRYYKLNYSKITGYGTPNYPKYYSFDHNYDYSDATSGHSGNTV